MSSYLYKISLVLLLLLTLLGCQKGQKSQKGEIPSSVQSAIDGTSYLLSDEVRDTLAYMGNEERLAHDIYNRLYETYPIQQFTTIAYQAERNHIDVVQQLVQKYQLDDTTVFSNVDLAPLGYRDTSLSDMEAGVYDISEIQALYDTLLESGLTSRVEALKVGCSVEVKDVTDLDGYIERAYNEGNYDIWEVYSYLRDGSYNHYWAFSDGLISEGIEEGCCYWSTLCHREYPQNSRKGS